MNPQSIFDHLEKHTCEWITTPFISIISLLMKNSKKNLIQIKCPNLLRSDKMCHDSEVDEVRFTQVQA